jgi:acyl-CoA thioester hydrolase
MSSGRIVSGTCVRFCPYEHTLKIDDQLAATDDSAGEVCETRLRVRYAETDQMGVVYHANYIVWFEVGRVELLRQLGFTYSEMEKQDGTHIAVVDVRCRFKAPALYDELITIRTRLLKVRESLLHFGYEVVRDGDGTLLAQGETVHLVVDEQFKRTVLPEKYLRAFLHAVGKS